MASVMPRRSSSGPKSRFVDRAAVIATLRAMARDAHSRMPNVEYILLFGSHARGDATARSDVDLLVVLKSSEHPRKIDRIPGLLEALQPCSLPLDVIPWTVDEIAKASTTQATWLEKIRRDAVQIWP